MKEQVKVTESVKREKIILLPVPLELNRKPAIFMQDKQWHVTLHADTDDSIIVSDRLGKIMYLAFRGEKELGVEALKTYSIQKETEKFKILFPFYDAMNCHKVVLYVLNDSISNIQYEDTFDMYGIKRIKERMEQPWDELLSIDDFFASIEDAGAGYPLVVTMFALDGIGNLHPVHSYLILGKDSSGTVLSFHKGGSGVIGGAGMRIEPARSVTDGYMLTARQMGYPSVRFSAVPLKEFTS